MLTVEISELPAKIIIFDELDESLRSPALAIGSVKCLPIHCRSKKDLLQFLNDEDVAAWVIYLTTRETDALEVARKIRRSPTQKQAPILFVTSTAPGEAHPKDAYELGAVDFIREPVDPFELHSKLQFFTELSRVRRELRQKTFQLEQSAEAERTFILEHALDAVVAADQDNLVLFWNEHAERLFGWTKSEIVGHDMSTFIIPERFRQMHRAGVRRFVETGVAHSQDQRLEVMGLRRNGREFLMELTVSSVRTPSGIRFYSFMRDISVLKEAQNRIVESESTLTQIFSESPSFMSFVRGPEFIFERVNDEYLKLVGRKDIIGKRVIDAFPEVEAQGFIELLRKVYETKVPYVGNEVPLMIGNAVDGVKHVFVDFVYQALTHADGSVFGIASQGYDVTEKVISRRRIEDSERQLRAFAESIPPLAYVADNAGNVTYFNQRFYSYTGIPVGEGKGWDWQSFKYIHPDDEANVVAKWKVALAAAETFEMEFRLRRYDGQQRWHLSRATPAKDQNGNVLSWYGTHTDIHDQKTAAQKTLFLSRASQALNSSLDVNKILTELAKVTVPAIADWCSIRMKNPAGKLAQVAVAHCISEKVKWAWELEARFPPDENAPFGPLQLMCTSIPELVTEVTDEMLIRGTRTEEQKRLLESIGIRSYICIPISAREKIAGTLTLVTTDESGRRYTDADLGLAEELGARAGTSVENARLFIESQNINKLKDEFLASLSHELRTPMNVIQGHADILESEVHTLSSEDLMDSIHAISRNARAQTAIIGDLLDVSSIITGKFSYKPVEMVPASTIREILRSLQHTAEIKGVSVVFRDMNSTEHVLADPTRLHQILWNLLSNAIKFTERGGSVTVEMSRETDRWSFSVGDTGKGIDPEFLPYVFDRFRQEDATTTRRYGGLGLGLSIVRHLVELHGGQVQAQSNGLGKGAKFTVTLPLKSEERSVEAPATKAAADAKIIKPAGPHDLKGVTVLLIDDSADNRTLIRIYLAKVGAIIIEAESAADARAKLETSTPQIILSDIGMPGENGMEFIRKLRNSRNLLIRDIPAIALTAYVREEEKHAVLQSGFHSHLSKPVSSSSLVTAIRNLLYK